MQPAQFCAYLHFRSVATLCYYAIYDTRNLDWYRFTFHRNTWQREIKPVKTNAFVKRSDFKGWKQKSLVVRGKAFNTFLLLVLSQKRWNAFAHARVNQSSQEPSMPFALGKTFFSPWTCFFTNFPGMRNDGYCHVNRPNIGRRISSLIFPGNTISTAVSQLGIALRCYHNGHYKLSPTGHITVDIHAEQSHHRRYNSSVWS